MDKVYHYHWNYLKNNCMNEFKLCKHTSEICFCLSNRIGLGKACNAAALIVVLPNGFEMNIFLLFDSRFKLRISKSFFSASKVDSSSVCSRLASVSNFRLSSNVSGFESVQLSVSLVRLFSNWLITFSRSNFSLVIRCFRASITDSRASRD